MGTVIAPLFRVRKSGENSPHRPYDRLIACCDEGDRIAKPLFQCLAVDFGVENHAYPSLTLCRLV